MDGTIELIKGKVEEVSLPDGIEKVFVICNLYLLKKKFFLHADQLSEQGL